MNSNETARVETTSHMHRGSFTELDSLPVLEPQPDSIDSLNVITALDPQLSAAQQTINELLNSSGTSDAADALSYFDDPEMSQLCSQIDYRWSMQPNESNKEQALDRFIDESLREIEHSIHSSNHEERDATLTNGHQDFSELPLTGAILIARARLGSLRLDDLPLSSHKSELFGTGNSDCRTQSARNQSIELQINCNGSSASSVSSSTATLFSRSSITSSSGLTKANQSQTSQSNCGSPSNRSITSIADQSIATNRLHGSVELKAEIISAKIVESFSGSYSNRRFVSYTLLFKRSRGLENTPCILERRYTDFARLYRESCLIRPEYRSIDFPRKQLLGNFRLEVIAARSRQLVQFLHLILSDDSIVNSDAFASFAFDRELIDCNRLMRSNAFEDALSTLENAYCMHKLIILRLGGVYRLRRFDVLFVTCCAIVACLHASDQPIRALEYIDRSFDLCDTHCELFACELIIPLLLLAIQLQSIIGRDYSTLNRQLVHLHQNGVRYNRPETLIDLLLLPSSSYLRVHGALYRYLFIEHPMDQYRS